MKVFLITTSSFPYGMADTKRLLCYAKAICHSGTECEVVVYKRNSGFNNSISDGEVEGIPFHYVSITPSRSNNYLFARISDFLDRFRLISYLAKKIKKTDIVFCYGSLYTTILIDLLHLKGGYFVVNLTEYPFFSGCKSLFQKYYRWFLLKKLFPKCDGVISISDALVTFAQENTSSKCKHLKVPILVDFKSYDLKDLSQENKEKSFIFHAGSLTESKDGILGMLEAFGLYSKKYSSELDFICTGTIEKSPHCKEIKELIQRYQLGDRVHFTGYLTGDEYRDLLQKATLVIINKYPTLQNKYCFSTKLGEYMAAGKAIIITNVGEAMNWVHDEKDVFIVPPQDVNTLADKIEYVLSRQDLRRNVSRQARETCLECFDYKNYGRTLLGFFSELE